MTGDRMTYDQLMERWRKAKKENRALEQQNALLLSTMREVAHGKYMRRANSALIEISSMAKDAIVIAGRGVQDD